MMGKQNKSVSLGRSAILAVAAVGGVFAFTGCEKHPVTSYTVPKEVQALEAQPAAQQVAHAHWETPEGWQEKKGDRMRAGTFTFSGSEGRKGELAIIPLPGVGGIELESVNLWRKELGLLPISAEEAKDQKKPVEVAEGQGDLYEMVSETAKIDGKYKSRLLGVIYPRKGTLWFFKMTGEDALVSEEKPKFINFLKSVDFHDGGHGPQSQTSAPSQPQRQEQPVQTAQADNANPDAPKAAPSAGKFPVPAHWKNKTPGPMLLASYDVPGENGTAETTISRFPGDVGGLEANVNRWRGQLSLPPAASAEIKGMVTQFDAGGAKANMVDMKGTNARSGKTARMVAVMLTTGGQTSVYKLMGDDAVVEKEKENLVKLVQEAHK